MSETVKQRNRREKRPKINMVSVLAALAFIGIVVLLALGSMVIKKYTPSKERVDLEQKPALAVTKKRIFTPGYFDSAFC